LRPLVSADVQFHDSAPPLHRAVDQSQQIGERTVVFRGLLERDDFIFGWCLERLGDVPDVAAIDVDPVGPEVVQHAGDSRQQIRSPAGTRRRATGHVPATNFQVVAHARPRLPKTGIRSLQEAGRGIRQELHPSIVCHLDEAAGRGRVGRSVLIAPEQTRRVGEFVEHLDQLDAMIAQPVEFLFIIRSERPRLPRGILAEVVAALRRQIVGNQMRAHTRADRPVTTADVLQPPPVVVGRVTLQHGRRAGTSGRRQRCLPFPRNSAGSADAARHSRAG